MIVSWNWLCEYLPEERLEGGAKELAGRLTMAGLNVDSLRTVDGDSILDVEVTSNRPDCLGHIGIAREASVLFGKRLVLPQAAPAASKSKTQDATSVTLECPDLCPQYTARVIRGVKIGSSPAWLRKRLEAVGQPSINNVVDVTNYVLMESGQPLHAFDFDRLHGGRIVVRRAKQGEKLVAINQRTYELEPDMCVIADADRPVALGGVMGGLETEIGPTARNVLLEAANFAPLSIRNTARKLSLHSDSSYRFERGVDACQLDWASLRACQLILDVAGGELLDDVIFAGRPPVTEREPITLRFHRIATVLGIEVPTEEAIQILAALGLEPQGKPSDGRGQFRPPTWRRDLSREIDLIEEVARIHGYDRIPQNSPVPLQASHRTLRRHTLDEVRQVLTAAGFFEAVTMSFVSESLCDSFCPRGVASRLRVEHSSRKHENVLRQSLVPSLLVSRQLNERHGTFNADLFEVAKVFLGADASVPENRREPTAIGLVTGRGFLEIKGIVAALAQRVAPRSTMTVEPSAFSQFAPGRGADLFLDGTLWGWLGELDRGVTDGLDLKDAVTVAELDLPLLESKAELVTAFRPLAQYPAIDRDLNFVLSEEVTWETLESVVREAAGPLLEHVGFGGQYRGKQIDANKKSYLVTLSYRAPDRTLTAEEVDRSQQAVIEACTAKLGARLR